jgi:hypothetical protein
LRSVADRYGAPNRPSASDLEGDNDGVYHDALRDLAAPAMRRPPVIRIDAADRDAAGAYQRARDRIHDALE